jgi:hypothetical protein
MERQKEMLLICTLYDITVTIETVYGVNITKPSHVRECNVSVLGLNLKDHKQHPCLTEQKRGNELVYETFKLLAKCCNLQCIYHL